ncbi:FtsL-like putative cell division protein [Porphyromonas macacae]|uniref:FtsL-like putative cell division protein n=1 Tax=Porphyromonas macacae TaxID=28115 RepID=UPI0035A0099D
MSYNDHNNRYSSPPEDRNELRAKREFDIPNELPDTINRVAPEDSEDNLYLEELSDALGDEYEHTEVDVYTQENSTEKEYQTLDREEATRYDEEEDDLEPDYPEATTVGYTEIADPEETDAEEYDGSYNAIEEDGQDLKNEDEINDTVFKEDHGVSTGEQKENSHKRSTTSIWALLGEGFIHKSWFRNNIGILIWIAVLFCINIYRGYYLINQVKEIDRLENELRDIQYRALFKSSDVTASSQKMNIERAIERENLGLKPSTQPPYIIRTGKAPEEK